jgi:hypothetical protein
VVDKGSNWNLLRQFRNASSVVGVIVGQQHEVDLAYPRVFGGCGNASCIEPVVPCPPGINEQGFPFRSYKQRRLTAIHIDEVRMQPFACSISHRLDAEREQYHRDPTHPRFTDGFTHEDQAPPSSDSVPPRVNVRTIAGRHPAERLR